MKKLAKKAVAAVLGYQVRKLYKKNDFKIVAVVGSIGKTSTKLAIAQTLSTNFRVCYQEGNYNDLVTVPLVFFGEPIPNIFNPFAWLAVFWRNRAQLRKTYPYDVVVLELGTDGPGQIIEFNKYLRLEIAVVTAISPEHMQFFETMTGVAKEELSVSEFSSIVLANKDLCDSKFLKALPNLLTYSIKTSSDFRPVDFELELSDMSQPEQYSRLAAAAVAQKLGMSLADIKKGLKSIQAVPGRMRILNGINGSTIIDDSYNSSPVAVKLALDYLYKLDSSQKIAVLGNMNELGAYSQAAHEEVGRYCDPKQLALVITIGPDANKYLAPSAEAKGCKVHSFDSPYTIGDYLKPILKKGAVVLAKGSQNGVFVEETVKQVLAKPADSVKLVRQTPQWLALKQKAFGITKR